MGYTFRKISGLTAGFIAVFLFLTQAVSAQENERVKLYRLKFPFYEEDKDLPTVLLTADEARPVGVRFELKGVKLRWIGDNITEIKGTITTPSAVYDKSSLQVIGDEKIVYRSEAMDLDGVGFDIDQIKQTIHIRKKVKVVLKSLSGGTGHKVKLGKIALDKTRKGIVLEEIKPKKSNTETELNENSKGNFDWHIWMWLIILSVGTGIILIFLMKRNVKRVSGKNPGKKVF